MTENFAWSLGVDWGSEQHQLCLVDATGAVRGTRQVAHRAEDVQTAVQWILRYTGARPEEIAVGIETPRGVLVDTFIEQRFAVFALNPKQLDRFRDRFTASGAKDDDRDAHVLADALRTDRRAFRRVDPDDPQIIQLRELSRIVEELGVEEGRLTNRLREHLYRVNAAWLTLSPAADDPWLWTLLRDTPHPDAWPTLPRRRIAPVLRAHRIRRVTVDEVIAAVRQPRFTSAAGVTDAVAIRVRAVVPQLVLIHEQRLAAQRAIDALLDTLAAPATTDPEPREHRDVEILQSLPGVGRMVTATMLTEAVGPLATREYVMLRAVAGTAPVTKRSGKRLRTVRMRYACNQRLRGALFHWARTSIQLDVAARAYYDAVRRRGHGHARALRSVGDRWLRILVAMLTSRTLYDPTRGRQTSPIPA